MSPDTSLMSCLALSGDAQTVKLSKYLRTLPETHSIAIFVGAMARGRDDFADHVVDEKISISEYPLSASVACGKVRRLYSSHQGTDGLLPSSAALSKIYGTLYNLTSKL